MTHTGSRILYVGGEQPGTTAVLDALRERGADPLVIHDVYMALARLGRGSVQPAAVVVCVDALQPAEMEFFRLASREHACAPVYACGRSGGAAKLEQAVRAGARGVLAAQDVSELLYDLEDGSADIAAASAPAAACAAERAVPEQPLPDDENGEEPNESDASASARVPWRRYDGRPVRTPPGGSSAPAQDQAFDGPLLTREELEALMREDFRTLPAEPLEEGEPS